MDYSEKLDKLVEKYGKSEVIRLFNDFCEENHYDECIIYNFFEDFTEIFHENNINDISMSAYIIGKNQGKYFSLGTGSYQIRKVFRDKDDILNNEISYHTDFIDWLYADSETETETKADCKF